MIPHGCNEICVCARGISPIQLMYKSPEQEHTTVLAYACGRTLHPRESEGIILLQAVLDGSPPGLHPEQIAEIEAALLAGMQACAKQLNAAVVYPEDINAAIDGLEKPLGDVATPTTTQEPAEPVVAAPETTERYAHSLSTMRLLGRLMLSTEAVSPDELERAKLAQWTDHLTRVAEMLKTDPEFRSALDIDHRYRLQVVDGVARNPLDESESMVEMLVRSRDAAIDAAAAEPQMWSQVVRDTHDARFAQASDDMPEGHSRMGVSMFPRHAMERDGQNHWESKGYRWGLVFMSFQAKAADGSREAGVVSIDVYDEAIFRQVLQENSIVVPEAVGTDEWLSYATDKEMNADETFNLLRDIRTQYYGRVWAKHHRIEVMDYIAQNISAVQSLFDVFSTKISISVASGTLRHDLRSFIENVVNLPHLTDETKQRLQEAYSTGIVTDDVGRDLDNLVCYATVEQLRKGLPEAIGRDLYLLSGSATKLLHVASVALPFNVLDVARIAGNNIGRGTAAGRSYGGCSPEMKIAPQDNAGRIDDEANTPASTAESEVDPNQLLRCPHCNVKSPASEVVKKDKWECPACKYSVDVCTGEVKNEGGRMAKKQERTRLAAFFKAATQGSRSAERKKVKQRKNAQLQHAD